MINSTTSTERSLRPEIPTPTGPAATRAAAQRTDTMSTANAAALRSALAAQPEIRPEVVERARALAADPGYPPASVIEQVGRQILAAPDLSEDQS